MRELNQTARHRIFLETLHSYLMHSQHLQWHRVPCLNTRLAFSRSDSYPHLRLCCMPRGRKWSFIHKLLITDKFKNRLLIYTRLSPQFTCPHRLKEITCFRHQFETAHLSLLLYNSRVNSRQLLSKWWTGFPVSQGSSQLKQIETIVAQ